MVRISPDSASRNPAPAEARTCRTVMVKSLGAPAFVGSSDKERCVLAMHTGKSPRPHERSRSMSFWAECASSAPFAP